MRTVKQLAKVSGIDYETVRYYCTPLPRKNDKGENEGRRGAGLIQAASKRGNWNLYDDKALYDLLVISMFRKADFSIKDIREFQHGDKSAKIAAFDKQEMALRRKREELERQIRLSRALRMWASDEGSEDEREAILLCELLSLGLQEAMEAIAEAFEEVGDELLEAFDDEDGPMSPYHEMERKRTQALLGGEEVSKVVANIEKATEGIQRVEEQDTVKMVELVVALMDGFKNEDPPGSERAQECMEALYSQFTSSVVEVEKEAAFFVYLALDKGGLLATAIELALGEGSVEYLTGALLHFCARALEEKRADDQERTESEGKE